LIRGSGGRKRRVLKRQEDADISAARIQRSHERHHQQGPERRQAGESKTGQHHQHGCSHQQASQREAVPPATDGQRGDGRAAERRRAEQAHFELAVPEREQVGRQ
jgi:hypothetical protein